MPCPLLVCDPGLPVSRVVRAVVDDKTLRFNDSCQQMALFLTDDPGLLNINAVVGDADFNVPFLTPDSRVRYIGTLSEILLHFQEDSQVYSAALVFFQQAERAVGYKLGFYDFGNESLVGALDAIIQCDWCWNILTHTHFYSPANGGDYITEAGQLSDSAVLDAVSEWCNANYRQFYSDTWDVRHEDPSDQNTITRRLRRLGQRLSATFYHEGWCKPIFDNSGVEIATHTHHPYLSMYQAAYSSGVDFSVDNSMYDAKWKQVTGIEVSRRPSDVVTAVTGFIPAVGLDPNSGHFANMYLKIGYYDMMAEGIMVTGHFISVVHAIEYMRADVQQEIYATIRNRRTTPNTERGHKILDATIIRRAINYVNAGIISDDFDPDSPLNTHDSDGNFLGAFSIERGLARNLPQWKKSQGFSQQYHLCFRVAIPMHYADIVLCARV